MFTDKYDMFMLVDLSDVKVFESATVQNCIPFIKKSASRFQTIIAKPDGKNIVKAFVKSHSELVQSSGTQLWNLTQEKRTTDAYKGMHLLGDILYISVGFVPNSDEKEKIDIFKKEALISNDKDDVPRRDYIEGKDLDRYKINRVRYMEYGTERAPAKFRRPTFPELYLLPKILFNRLGELKSTIDEEARFIHNDSLIAGIRWCDLNKVDNKSITSSIKKFSSRTRDDMEKISSQYSLKYLLAVVNCTHASYLLSINRAGDYHIYPEHLRNLPVPTATVQEQQEISTLVDLILNKAKENDDYSTEQQELDSKINRLYGVSSN